MKGDFEMKELISILPEILLLTMLTSAFAILCLTLHKVFEQMQLFRGKLAVLMAALISVLAVVGTALLLLFPSSSTAAESDNARTISLNYSLLSVIALAATVILLQLFVIVAATAPAKTDEGLAKEPTKPKSHGRPKNEEAEAPMPAQKSRARGKNNAETGTTEEAAPKTQNDS